MNTTLAVLGVAVAVAAAARSTWSPCGLSMLSSITPLAERSRGHRFGVTATWFVLGADGRRRHARVWPRPAWPRCVRATGLSRTRRVRSRRCSRWCARSRICARSGGTCRSTAARSTRSGSAGTARGSTPAASAGRSAPGSRPTSSPPRPTSWSRWPRSAPARRSPLGLGLVFGLVRGLAVFLAAGITTPTRLHGFHRRFDRVGPTVRGVVIGVQFGVAAIAAAIAWIPAAAAVVRRRGPTRHRRHPPLPRRDAHDARTAGHAHPGARRLITRSGSRRCAAARRTSSRTPDEDRRSRPGGSSPGAEAGTEISSRSP